MDQPDPTEAVPRHRLLERLARRASELASSTWGTTFALMILTGWLAIGPVVGFGEAWYYADAVMSAVVFLMLFLLQRSQSKDSMAIQIKLNELLAAVHKASPKLINIEDLDEEEIRKLHHRYQDLQTTDPGSHSIHEEAS